MLHSMRQRLQQFAEREAAGETLWTHAFSERVRTRVMHVLGRVMGMSPGTHINTLFSRAQRLIVEQEGVFFLTSKGLLNHEDLFAYCQACPDQMYPTVIEALAVAFTEIEEAEQQAVYGGSPYSILFTHDVNEIFAQERVGWELIEGRMIEIHSKELHTAAVEPALRLLHRSEFAKADKQYRDALEELAQGKAADAITDAGATLQEMLEALGCEGNQLGDLARSARKKGLLGAHDTPLVEAIEKTMHWVAADRSEMGDAHHATEATREDAWLIVHVVGALIVRLASGQARRK